MGFHLPKIGWNKRLRRKDESSEIMRSLYHRVHQESNSGDVSCDEPKSAAVPSTLPSESVAVNNGSQPIQGEEIQNPIVLTVRNNDFLVAEVPSVIVAEALRENSIIKDEDEAAVDDELFQKVLLGKTRNGVQSDDIRTANCAEVKLVDKAGSTQTYGHETLPQDFATLKVDDVPEDVVPVEALKEEENTLFREAGLQKQTDMVVDSLHMLPSCTDADIGHGRHASKRTLVQALDPVIEAFITESGIDDPRYGLGEVDQTMSTTPKLDRRTDFGQGSNPTADEPNTNSMNDTLNEHKAPGLLLKTRQQGYENDMEDFHKVFAEKINDPEQEHEELTVFREQKHEIVMKQLPQDVKLNIQEKQRLEEALTEKSRTCKIQEEELDSLDEQITNSMGEFEALKKQSNKAEKQLKKDVWYLEGLVKEQGIMLKEVINKYDSCVRDYDTACRGYQEVTQLQRSTILSLQEDFAKTEDLNPKDETTFNYIMARLETAEEALSEMTRLRDGLADQNIIQQQEAEIWESKAHRLQGIQEGANDPLSYDPEGLLAFKVAELEKLEKRSSALLTEHHRLESASKFDAQASAATIESFMTTTKQREETIEELREQKANIQQANEGLLEALTSRISDKNTFRIAEAYHTLIRDENSKLGDEIRELQLKLNAANEKVADKEILNLTTACKMSDLADEHSGCDAARRKLESKVNTLQIEMELIPQDYEKVIKPMTAKIEILEARLQRATEEIQRLRRSSASEIIIREYERKDSMIAHVKKLLEECREEKAELDERYAQQTYFRSLDMGYSECHEEALEESRHQLKKVVAERDDLLEQLSFCRPMQRFEFRDYKAEITEARALAEARDKELEATKTQHSKDLDEMDTSIYNLRNLNLHFCGWTEKLENRLKEYGTALDDDDDRYELLAWSKKLLKGFQPDRVIVEAGDRKSVFCNDLEEGIVLKKAERLSEGDAKAPSHGMKNLTEDIEEEAIVDEAVELSRENGEWETDTDSEDASDSQEADLSESDVQEIDSNPDRSELSKVSRGKQRASSSPTSSGWHTDSSGA